MNLAHHSQDLKLTVNVDLIDATIDRGYYNQEDAQIVMLMKLLIWVEKNAEDVTVPREKSQLSLEDANLALITKVFQRMV